MEASDARLEVVDVERPGIVVAVPADDIERMVIQDELGQPKILLDEDAELAFLVVRRQVAPDGGCRARSTARVPVVGRAHCDIASACDVSRALDHRKRCGHCCQPVAMQDAARDDEVVAGAKWQLAHLGLEHSLAFGDIHDLVALRVAIEEAILLLGRRRSTAPHRD